MAGWLLLAAIAASTIVGLQWWLLDTTQNPAVVFMVELPVWLSWAVMTPVILRLGAQWPLDNRHWYQRLPLHLAFGLSAAFACIAATVAARTAMGYDAGMGYRSEVVSGFRQTFGSFTLIYFGVLALHHSLAYRTAYLQQVEQRLRADAELSTARLQMVQAQLQPHFLFNTLNTISSFVTREPRVARQMIVQLSELLRAVLHRTTQHDVTVEDELRFANNYLAIQQLRFSDLLTVEVIAQPDALQARVPPMLLQPLIENALKHGLADGERIHVTVRASISAGRLRLSVTDTGAGFPAGAVRHGHGLLSVENLLAQRFGSDYSFVFGNRRENGAEVVIDLPNECEPRHSTPARMAGAQT